MSLCRCTRSNAVSTPLIRSDRAHRLHRPDPEAYQHPDEFIPERFTDQPELIKKKGAFAPFSMGAMGCVGKNLAYMEIRAVLAMLLTQFDIAFAPQEDGTALIQKTEDHFTLNLADLMLVCQPRKAR